MSDRRDDAADRGTQLMSQTLSGGTKSIGSDDCQRDPLEADVAGMRGALGDLDAVTMTAAKPTRLIR
jgi:hypothetical protein